MGTDRLLKQVHAWKSVVDFSGEQSHLYVPVYGTILIKLPVPASCSNCGSFPLQFYFEV